MKHLMRPKVPVIAVEVILFHATLFCAVISSPRIAHAQSAGLAQFIEDSSPAMHAAAPGYMGVLVGDLDQDSAQKLKAKDTHGAVVTLIDHDAPASQAGIRVNDVVLEVNGQPVENAEQFSRLLRDVAPGHTVTLVVSRDGTPLNVSLELVDRKKMEHDVWNRLDKADTAAAAAPTMGILSGAGDVPDGGFHMSLWSSTLNVGAMVEPLTAQMSAYLGLGNGLMIKQVARKSEADAAGLKAFDVIVKVGNDLIATSADWDRALRTNQDKPVQVTILRDRRQQTVTLQVDSKHRHS